VGTEHDCGVLTGDYLTHDCLLCRVTPVRAARSLLGEIDIGADRAGRR
jgi:hypothetical protein